MSVSGLGLIKFIIDAMLQLSMVTTSQASPVLLLLCLARLLFARFARSVEENLGNAGKKGGWRLACCAWFGLVGGRGLVECCDRVVVCAYLEEDGSIEEGSGADPQQSCFAHARTHARRQVLYGHMC